MTDTTIAAISTPPGTGGIAVIRLSGNDAFSIADKVWKGFPLSTATSHTAHLGEILDTDGTTLDSALATVFHEGKSFTGEPTVEFSAHGSPWIQNRIVERLIEEGASAAAPGEFTQRAFANGRLDLAQAEAVADMIAASSKASQRLAAQQMKGVFSQRLEALRNDLIDIASLLELELDFSEEDVEFADRSHLLKLTSKARSEIQNLADSFRAGKALKEGVAVVIAGRPNAGKSTLLNRLLQDDKAIVSDIAGTTRDIIEDTIEIEGILYRFIDTAGLRDTSDDIEKIGVERAIGKLSTADIIILMIDSHDSKAIDEQIKYFSKTLNIPSDTDLIVILNKCDLNPDLVKPSVISERVTHVIQTIFDPAGERHIDIIPLSAKNGDGYDNLIHALTTLATAGHNPAQDLIVTNARHFEALHKTAEALTRVEEALTSPLTLPPDLISQDLREATHHLGTITGSITPSDLLQTIFSRFCVGK